MGRAWRHGAALDHRARRVRARFRRGDEVERLQVRWFGAAVAVCALGAIGAAIESSIRPGDGPLVTTLVLYGGILAIPISIGVAVLRYRLYELDRIISRTIAYGLISGLLLGAYALLILFLQGPLGRLTGGKDYAEKAVRTAAWQGGMLRETPESMPYTLMHWPLLMTQAGSAKNP